MRQLIFRFAMLLLLTATVLAACQNQAGAAQAVEDYLRALNDKNLDQMTALSCADWEAEASRELDSFSAVETELSDLQCEEAGTDGEFTLIACAGTITVSYEDETQTIDLSGRTYLALFEGGDWRMCGYTEQGE